MQEYTAGVSEKNLGGIKYRSDIFQIGVVRGGIGFHITALSKDTVAFFLKVSCHRHDPA